MAGSEQTWNTAFELIPANSDAPKDLPQQFQDHKVTVRSKLEKEHVGDVDAATPLSGEHKAGSAKAYSQSAEPTLRPDGSTSLTDDDSGRLWHDTDDNSVKVLVDDGGGGVEPKHLFEDDAVDDSVDPTGTLASLQDKIDALAHQVKALSGKSSWATSVIPKVGYNASIHGSAITTGAVYAALAPYIPNVGDKIPVTGGCNIAPGGGNPVTQVSFAERLNATTIQLNGMSGSTLTSVSFTAALSGSYNVSLTW